MASNMYAVMYHDLLEAIKASNPEQLNRLILAIQLSPAEKKTLLNFAKQTVNKRQKKIDKRNNRVMLGNALKVTGVGIPVGLYLDARGTGAVLGLGIATGGTKILLNSGTPSSALTTLTGIATGLLGCFILEKFLWWKAQRTDETLRINHSNALQIREFLLTQFKR